MHEAVQADSRLRHICLRSVLPKISALRLRRGERFVEDFYYNLNLMLRVPWVSILLT